jgi:transposase-like protein
MSGDQSRGPGPHDLREQVLVVAAVQGSWQAARHFGVPYTTVKRWVSQARQEGTFTRPSHTRGEIPIEGVVVPPMVTRPPPKKQNKLQRIARHAKSAVSELPPVPTHVLGQVNDAMTALLDRIIRDAESMPIEKAIKAYDVIADKVIAIHALDSMRPPEPVKQVPAHDSPKQGPSLAHESADASECAEAQFEPDDVPGDLPPD